LISRFDADYNRVNWVPYKLTCTIIRDESAAALAPLVDLAGSLMSDLNVAAPTVSIATTTAALAQPGGVAKVVEIDDAVSGGPRILFQAARSML
jgi:hypothetical protein